VPVQDCSSEGAIIQERTGNVWRHGGYRSLDQNNTKAHSTHKQFIKHHLANVGNPVAQDVRSPGGGQYGQHHARTHARTHTHTSTIWAPLYCCYNFLR